MQRTLTIGWLGGWICLAVCSFGWAQQATMGNRSVTGSNGFYESIGSSWGFNYKGVSVNFGNGSPVQSGFGGAQPGSGAQFGWATRGNGFNGYFYGWAGQGSNSSLSSISPSVTMMNGGQGMISNTTQRPFVIGVVPVVGGGVSPVMALNGISPLATTVQLPEYSMFGVNTSVSVPDSGGAFLGGVNRGQMGANQNGPLPSNRSSGASRSATGASVKASVHDFAAMDEQLLGGNGSVAKSAPPAAKDTSSAARAVASVAEARRQHEAEQSAGDDASQQYLAKARQAEEDGKLNLAKAYYQLALHHTDGDQKSHIAAKLQELKTGRTVARKDE